MNRKARRAAPPSPLHQSQRAESLEEVPLLQPDRSGPKTKTLYEFAAEREAELSAQAAAQQAQRDGDIGAALGHALFLGPALSMLHFTLDVLVYHQYRQDMAWGEIARRSGTAAPMLMLLVFAMHSATATRVRALRQAVFFLAATVAGCHLVYAGNKYQYFAVMKAAPPVGTLWVWSIIELRLELAVPSLLVVGACVWWNGFTVF